MDITTALFRHIDAYCERLSSAFWAEPFNAISNLGFVAAGLIALGQARRQNAGPMVRFLSLMVVLVGIGSFLFHTFANTLAMFGDLIPIFIFTSAYLFHSLRHYLKWKRSLSWLALVVMIAAMVATETLSSTKILNGSLLYAPPLIMLFYVALALKKHGHDLAGSLYLKAAGVFLLSLFMRTIDSAICEIFPIGTHFLWHLLNGICLWILLKIALNFQRDSLNP
ncbi:MAG: ceramidase domain-containing protein [Bdellovibrionales bacterium]|jgi:hypothetical protein|nr:ceramidase domain-containing protein [Bdellovibrionales bacterium]